jgi:CRP-like cAMP-binding protein
MSDWHDPRQNHLLAALSAAELEYLSPYLDLFQVSLGDILCESGAELRYVYFPTTCIVSLLYDLEDGRSAEIARIGNEGILGIALLMGGETMPNRAMVQSVGYAYRLKSQLLKNEFNRSGGRRSGEFQKLLLRYTQALMTQISQTAVCNRLHSVEQQLCRWLLQSLDRIPTNELSVTQELIAQTLGVRREGITEAAGKLQRVGLISYHRGHITVLDRAGLKKRACECYKVVKNEFDRLLPDITATQAGPRCTCTNVAAVRVEKRASASRHLNSFSRSTIIVPDVVSPPPPLPDKTR